MIWSTKVKDFNLHKYANNPSVTSQSHAIFPDEFLTHSYNKNVHNDMKGGYPIFIFIWMLCVFITCSMQTSSADKVEVLWRMSSIPNKDTKKAQLVCFTLFCLNDLFWMSLLKVNASSQTNVFLSIFEMRNGKNEIKQQRKVIIL